MRVRDDGRNRMFVLIDLRTLYWKYCAEFDVPSEAVQDVQGGHLVRADGGLRADKTP